MATRQGDARSIMPIHICSACGTSYPEAATPPARCPICEDERQFVPRQGQSWTTPEALAARHANAWRELEPGLFEIHTRPDFAISQRALLLRTPQGNILWDCLTLIDDATIAIIEALGGLDAIAISHPHYYSRMQDWAHAFEAPVYLSAADREWVMRPDAEIQFWEGDDLTIAEGVTLLRLGGHFPGGTVLHWADGASGKSALLSGDILQVTPGGNSVSMLYSYPNMMPLSAGTVRRMASVLEPWNFERIYGAFPGREVTKDAKAAVARSVARYVELLAEER
jgi:hypothetical protein